MGVKDEGMGAVGRGSRSGAGHGNGMRDVWVVGEGFFRGVGAVFDVSLLSGFQCPDGRRFVLMLST